MLKFPLSSVQGLGCESIAKYWKLGDQSSPHTIILGSLVEYVHEMTFWHIIFNIDMG